MPIEIVKIIAVAGVLIAGVLIGVAHRRRPELPAFGTALSAYFTEPTRATMTVAYAAIAVALVSTAIVLMVDRSVAAVVAAVGSCAGAVLLVPVSATTQRNATTVRSEAIRRVHRYSAVAAFLSVGIAMAASAHPAVARASVPNIPVTFFGVLGVVLVGVVLCSRPGATQGLRQKAMLCVLGMWILANAAAG